MMLAAFISTATAFTPQINYNRQTANIATASRISTKGFTHATTALHMSTVLDRPTVKPATGSPSVIDAPTRERKSSPVKQRKSTGSEAWEVRIYNDGKNTREFVARCLVQIAALSELTAYQTMMQAHQNGIAVVGRYAYEVAEMYYGALKKNGIVCDLVPVEEEK